MLLHTLYAGVLVCAQSCPTLCDPMGCSPPGSSLSVEFPRQEHRSGLPLPSLRDLPDPGIKPGPPALQADSLPLSHLGLNLQQPIFCPSVLPLFMF